MAWFKVQQTLPDHRKTLMMARLMKVDKDLVVGKLVRLWSWSLDHADDDGMLPDLTDDQLGQVCGWFKKPTGAFIVALVEAGFLERLMDKRLVLHDWEEYAGRLNERRKVERERLEKKRATKRRRREDVGATTVQPLQVVGEVLHSLEREEEKESEKDVLSSERTDRAVRAVPSLLGPTAMDEEGFVQQYRVHYEQTTGKPIKGYLLIAAAQVEKEYGLASCMEVAPLLGWEKSPKYYVGALEDLRNGLDTGPRERNGVAGNGTYAQGASASDLAVIDRLGVGRHEFVLDPDGDSRSPSAVDSAALAAGLEV